MDNANKVQDQGKSFAKEVRSAPAVQQYHSPMRQHKRTPSQHREIKETLNARSEYTNDDTEGTKLRINQYVIKEEIGRGSYGAVHLATDQYGNEYAIKEFSKSRLRRRAQSNMLKRPGGLRPGRGMRSPFSPHSTEMSNQDAAEAKDSLFLIREEIAIMKKLNHPNLVSLIEVLDDPEEDSLWIVLEMCKKGVIMKIGLDDDAEPYTKEQCRYWFRDLILGIEYLHAQGIIHRDIKPDNLLLTEDDCLKIVDFGVSEMFEKSADMRTAKSAGSPAFLPPELCMAKHGDISGKAADIWSMGVSLYCLKYGKLPFHQHNVLEMYESIRTQELTLPPDEDADFVDLLKRMLTKDPEQRICMSGVRNHPWVTRDGEDPLLSESENITELVEPPNELELNHALTRKMSNMMTVMMAINKFKGLINKSRPSTPGLKTPGTPKTLQVPVDIPETSQETTPTAEKPQPENNRPRQKSVAEEAADLVEARKAFHASKEPFPGEKGPAQDATGSATAFLGIGLGGSDDFATAETPAEFVSDSPTGIDFDIYDRAFEAEMERIRSEKQHGGHRRKTYMTRFVNRKDKYFGDDCMIMEAGSGIPALASSGVDKVSSAAVKTLSHVGLTHRPGSSSVEDKDEGTWKKEHARDAVEARKIHGHDPIQGIKEKGHKFAELVMGTMSVAKSKVSGEAKESGQ
ncbi:kinase-like domain-containing protein [Truncatella angustata]|uniref:Kinase-like domain-containing protein n=1 Tax=Truncatella angustata TaxID=152316 RepID=A0A9P8ZXT1_9PEZI|nr:kinase-like domain-containing protein [Truncatella angustata]KAH6654319.1 kinase-like domain-containing protein [Truncatella angustata]